MYIEEMVTVGRAENGYVLNVRAPYKKEKSDYDTPVCCGREEKVIVCKDITEVQDKLAKLLPALKDEMDASEAFEQAFEEASD